MESEIKFQIVSCSFVCEDEIWDKREVFAIWVAIKTDVSSWMDEFSLENLEQVQYGYSEWK